MSSFNSRDPLMFCLFLLATVGPVLADDDVVNTAGSSELQTDSHQSVVLQMKQFLEGTKIVRQGERPVVEELNPKPILNWDDLPRGHHHGTLWVWGTKGRPAAIMELYSRNFSKSLNGWPGNVVHSLAPEALRTSGPLNWNWAPDKPGLVLRKLAKGGEVATGNRPRRSQMRELARRFASNQTWDGERSELRLLPTPILLYEDSDQGIVEGGLFVFVHGGTNPEVVLVLEAVKSGEELYWQFGCVRLGHAEMHVAFDDDNVWSVDTYSANDPKSTYHMLYPQ